LEDDGGIQIFPFLVGIGCVAIAAAEIAAGQTHEHAGTAGKGGLPLDAEENLVDLERHLFLPVRGTGMRGLRHLDPGNPRIGVIQVTTQFLVKITGDVFRSRVLLLKRGKVTEIPMVEAAQNRVHLLFDRSEIDADPDRVKLAALNVEADLPVVAVGAGAVPFVAP